VQAHIARSWQRWKRIARFVAQIQARIILTIFYFVITAPFALGIRLFSDPLRLRPQHGSAWLAREGAASRLPTARARP
jgi:hypothetical protein